MLSQRIVRQANTDLPIIELAELVCDVVGFEGTITKDTSKPDGTPRKLMSGAKLAAMGWRPKIALREGVEHAYAEFLAGHIKQPAG